MDTVITISGTDKSGASARILTFLARKGYDLKDYRITRSPSGSAQLSIKLDPAQLDHARLAAELGSLDPAYCVVQAPEQSATALLKAMTARFPDIAGLVRSYGASLSSELRDQALFNAGKRTGAFIYARDWSFGHPLRMPLALRRALLPALEKMIEVRGTDTEITLLDPRFCGTGAEVHCCEFLSGFMQGFLGASPATKNAKVQKSGCAATGALHCRYSISDEASA